MVQYSSLIIMCVIVNRTKNRTEQFLINNLKISFPQSQTYLNTFYILVMFNKITKKT